MERDGRFVVPELARWTAPDVPGGAPIDPTQTWCVFTVDDGKVTSVSRFESEDDVPPAGS